MSLLPVWLSSSWFVSLVVGIVFIVLAEHFHKRAYPDKGRRAEGHFWAVLFFILSFMAAEQIQGTYRLEQRVDAISAGFASLTDKQIEDNFRDIYRSYYTDFESPDERIKKWVKTTIAELRDDMKDGYISMPPLKGRNEMAEMYSTARNWVVATNVGSLEFFHKDMNYQKHNLEAFENRIPVIRFFLYGSPSGKGDGSFDLSKFRTEVITTMKTMNTVCSVLVKANQVQSSVPDLAGPQDFLLIDNSFVAHAKLDPNSWEMQRITATIRPANIQRYRQYLYGLNGISDKEVLCLDQLPINDKFNGEAILKSKMLGRGEGKHIFEGVMHEIARTRNN